MDSDSSAATKGEIRERLYEVMDDPDRSLRETQRRALELGRAYLGVQNGHIQRRNGDGETDDVVVSVGEDPTLLPEGTTLDRETTYCRRTVESTSPVALSDAAEEGWAEDPAYEEHGFDCYLGTTIFVDGDTYGTVCFVSRDSRAAEFEADEKAVVELIARLLGREIEARRRQRRIGETARARRRSEGKYEALLTLAPNAIFLAEAGSGAITEVNERAVALTGYAEDALLERSLGDLYPPAQREQYAHLAEGDVDEANRARFDDGTPLRLRRADGTAIPIELSARAVEIEERTLLQVIVRDVTERRERERELRLRSRAIEEATVGITIADATEPGTPIVYANGGFEALTGYHREAVIGENFQFLQGEATADSTAAALRRAIDDGEPIQTDLLNYRANGTPFWNRLTVAPVTTGPEDAVTHFVGIQEDVTGQKRRERLITVLDRVLRHNLRNDMTVVRGYADVIADRAEGEVASMADRIAETAADLVDLSETARDLESGLADAAPLAPRDVVSDVHDAVEDLRADYPDATFEVSASPCEDVLATSGLPVALRELGENAAAHGDSPSVTYRVAATADGRVEVRVTDTGPGIPDLDRRVLEGDAETPLEHGTGLGLWLVNWVVTGLGGEVSVDVDDGTTVTLRLPSAAAADRDVPPRHEHRSGAFSTRRE